MPALPRMWVSFKWNDNSKSDAQKQLHCRQHAVPWTESSAGALCEVLNFHADSCAPTGLSSAMWCAEAARGLAQGLVLTPSAPTAVPQPCHTAGCHRHACGLAAQQCAGTAPFGESKGFFQYVLRLTDVNGGRRGGRRYEVNLKTKKKSLFLYIQLERSSTWVKTDASLRP